MNANGGREREADRKKGPIWGRGNDHQAKGGKVLPVSSIGEPAE